MLETKPAIDVGDLVRLRDDKNLVVGLGIVLDRREDTKEIAESFFTDKDESYRDYMPELGVSEKDDYLLSSPVFLIWWQSSEDPSFSARPIWMFYSEIELVSPASRYMKKEKIEK